MKILFRSCGSLVCLLLVCSMSLASDTLEELMHGGAEQRDESGSLLSGIEQARSDRKMAVAQSAFEEHQAAIAKRCECVYQDNCPESSWDIESWPKTASYLNLEADATQRKRKVCDVALRGTLTGASIQEARVFVARAKEHREKLASIDSEMRERAFWAPQQYAEEQQRLAQERHAQEWQREERARLAAEKAEMEREWSQWGTSDEDFWAGIQATEDRVMTDIRAAERAAAQRREAERRERAERERQAAEQALLERQKQIEAACARNGGRYDSTTDRCEPVSKATPPMKAADEGDRQYCLEGGRRAGGGSCLPEATIVVHGWKDGNRAYVQASPKQPVESLSSASGKAAFFDANAKKADPSGPNRPGQTLADLLSPDSTGDVGSPTPSSSATTGGASGGTVGGGSSGGNGQDEGGPKIIFVFTDEESRFSWPTQEEACRYAKQTAVAKAEADCKEQFGGKRAPQSQVVGPVENSMCHSYRQMQQSGFTSTEGHWKAKSKTSFQCLLPDTPYANPVAPPAN